MKEKSVSQILAEDDAYWREVERLVALALARQLDAEMMALERKLVHGTGTGTPKGLTSK